MGPHSDSPRSPGCRDFNSLSHRLDQGSPTVMSRYFKISQGHPVSVCTECQTGSIRPPTIVPRQGIFHRWGMRPGSLPAPRFARQTRVMETTFYSRSCCSARPAVVVRISLFLTLQRNVVVNFVADTSDLDRCKFRARVRLDSAGASGGVEVSHSGRGGHCPRSSSGTLL
jgi:hypothetical protein